MNLVHCKFRASRVTDAARLNAVRRSHHRRVRDNLRRRVARGTGRGDRLQNLDHLTRLRDRRRQNAGGQRQSVRSANVAVAAVSLTGGGWKADVRRARDRATEEFRRRVAFRAHMETMDHVFEMDRLRREFVFRARGFIRRVRRVA